MAHMRGTIYIHAEAARALRSGERDLRVADILDCAGRFESDDGVHVVLRGADGGQGVVASATVRCAIEPLQQAARVTRSALVVQTDPAHLDGPRVLFLSSIPYPADCPDFLDRRACGFLDDLASLSALMTAIRWTARCKFALYNESDGCRDCPVRRTLKPARRHPAGTELVLIDENSAAPHASPQRMWFVDKALRHNQR